jgi:hypothetical protein
MAAKEHLSTAPFVEGSVPRGPIEQQRKWVGIAVACLGAVLVYFTRTDLPLTLFAIVIAVGLVWAVDHQAHRALRYGFSLRVFEDRIEFANAKPMRSLPLYQIDRLVRDEGTIVAELMSGERVFLPNYPELDDAYRHLLTKVPGNFTV